MMTRRTLLASTPAAAALAAVGVAGGCRRGGNTVVDVTNFGASGDGVTDDSLAIQAAVRALRPRGTLYFPRGTYRFAQRHPAGTAAIVIAGLSDVDVEFDHAELLMDNLDATERTGTSHGLLIRGPASGIALHAVNIRWAAGARRSLGDGIRVMGCPAEGDALPTGWSGPRAPIRGIALSDCIIRGSPQAGVIMLGASDITVAGLRVADSGADGLHFNACRRGRIDDFHARNTGDDGLALVTYFARDFTFDEAAHTFAFPALTNWSNADFVIDDVDVVGGKANGVRIAGTHRLTVGGLRVTGMRSGSAVMVDSAEPGSDVGWDYVASRAVRLGTVAATNCDTGIHLLARPGASGDERFTGFDVVIDEARLDGCDNWSVRAESLTPRRASGLRISRCHITATSTSGGNGGVGIANADNVTLGDLSIRHTQPVVSFTAVDAGRLAVDRLSVSIAASEQPATPAPPCVSIEDADGAIDELDLRWPAAPDQWRAVRLSNAGRCGDVVREQPVDTTNLDLAAVGDATVTCS